MYYHELPESVIDAIEAQGWAVTDCGDAPRAREWYIEIETSSPAGEDVIETIWIEPGQTIGEAARDWADSYDADDHAAQWIEHRGEGGCPSTVRELIDDAEAIGDMIRELADALAAVQEEEEEEEEGDA